MQSSSHFSAPDIPVGAPATTWNVRDVMTLMESWYPAATAQSWDRVGLIVGDPDAPVRSILLALDPTAAIADQAVRGPSGDGNSYDMVITHHPLLLRGASFLPVTDPKGGVVTTLIRSGIALFNAHTNADVAYDGVATALADLIGLRDTVPLEPCGTDTEGREIGLGRVGTVRRLPHGGSSSPPGIRALGGRCPRVAVRIALGDGVTVAARPRTEAA